MKPEQITVAILILINFKIKGHGQDTIKSTCGLRLVQQNALSTDGYKAKEGNWPWHADIYHTDSKDIKYKCSGTLINSNSILTAAHCIYEYGRPIAPHRVLVRLGKYNLKISGPNIQELEAFLIIPHPAYDTSNLQNDIAIIRLSTEAIYTDYVQPICLSDPNKVEMEELTENQIDDVEVAFQLTGNVMWSYNCDFTGGDIENHISKQDDCWKFCSKNPECTHFHWISSYGGVCLMKNFLGTNVKAVVKNDYNATCGWIIRQTPNQNMYFQRSGIHQWCKDCEFIGGDYESHKSQRDECWNLCADSKECTHFTWISSYGGICLLKKLEANATASVKKDFDSICGWVLQHTIEGDIKFQFSGKALWSNGCQYWIGSFVGEDTKRDNCAELCFNNELCTHFTWHTYGGDVGYCHLQNTHNLTAFASGGNTLCGKIIRPEVNGGYHFRSKLGLRWSLNCGFGGNNIGNEKSRLEDCGKICAEHQKCTHFSWNRQNGTCWLKTGNNYKPYQSLDSDDACGFSVWDWIYEGSLIWHTQCENNGGDIENLKSSLNDCIILCNKRDDCRSFNWTDFEGGMCWLKGGNSRLKYHYNNEKKTCGFKPK